MAKPTKPATADPAVAGMAEYIVNKNAPDKIAGMLVKAGDRLMLNDQQARFDEQAGHISRAPAASSKGE